MASNISRLPSAQTGSEFTRSLHVARQKIVDAKGALFAHELLFRNSPISNSAELATSSATSSVIAAFLDGLGSVHLPRGNRWFVNVTEDYLYGNAKIVISSTEAILEIPPEVVATREVCQGVLALSQRGYRLSLDNYSVAAMNRHDDLLEIASFVKLNFRSDSEDKLRKAANHVLGSSSAVLIGSRLQREAEQSLAREIGCELFQGFTIEPPIAIEVRDFAASLEIYTSLMSELEKPEAERAVVNRLVTSDAAIAQRLLRACNSASSGLGEPVDSIEKAVALLGHDRIREWVEGLTAERIAPGDFGTQATLLERARLHRGLARLSGVPPETGFLVGLLDGIAQVSNEAIGNVLNEFRLSEDIMNGVLAGEGRVGELVALVTRYENGDLSHDAAERSVAEQAACIHARAIAWSDRIVIDLSEKEADSLTTLTADSIPYGAAVAPSLTHKAIGVIEPNARRQRQAATIVASLSVVLLLAAIALMVLRNQFLPAIPLASVSVWSIWSTLRRGETGRASATGSRVARRR